MFTELFVYKHKIFLALSVEVVHFGVDMKSYPIPNFPRYTMDEDRFTVRCIRPYKKHIEPHVVRPWTLHRAPGTVFVTLRNAEDKVVNITIPKLVFLTFGADVYDLPPLPDDLVPLEGFPDYAYSAVEDAVCQLAHFHSPPYAPRRISKYPLKDDYIVNIRDYTGQRCSKRMSWIRKLAHGLVKHTPKENFDHNLPEFMRWKREKGPDSYKRRKYRSRRLTEPVDPSSALFTQGAGPEPAPSNVEQKTRQIAVSPIATIIVPEKPAERRFF